MPDYHRIYIPGGTYFFTLVTYDRLPILVTPEARDILRTAWNNVQKRYPFSTIALCILPDHLHCIWSLPEDEANYSLRWSEIKRQFSREYSTRVGSIADRTISRLKRREAAIWQRRFWVHLVCNEDDLRNHIDYIHYNPMKHGLVRSVSEWKWSTFHRFVKNGFYEEGWGGYEESKMNIGDLFGE
jgi:putative transposase